MGGEDELFDLELVVIAGGQVLIAHLGVAGQLVAELVDPVALAGHALLGRREAVGRRVQDLEYFVDDGQVLAARLGLALLAEDLDVAQLAEVEVALLLQAVQRGPELVELVEQTHVVLLQLGIGRLHSRRVAVRGRVSGWRVVAIASLARGRRGRDRRGGRLGHSGLDWRGRDRLDGSGRCARLGRRGRRRRGDVRGGGLCRRRLDSVRLALAGHQRYAVAHRQRVVLLAVVVGVEELLEPLHELEVVLEATLDQLLHGYDLFFIVLQK